MTPSTQDTLFDGQVRLSQPARGTGYRVNVDALHLADFARRGGAATVAFDLGAGVGAVSLALLYRGGAARVVLVEIDANAAALARANLDANGWSDRGFVVTADVSVAARSHRGEARLVVCNPPYFPAGRGRVAKNPARGVARSGELDGFVEAARVVLGRRGRACFAYPAREMATLFGTLRASGLEPKRMCVVRARPSDAARVVLVEAMAAKPGGLVLEPDLLDVVSRPQATR